jgi:hypothetical protein
MFKFSQLAIVCAGVGVLAACSGAGAPPTANVPAGPDWEYAGGVLFHHPHYAPTLRSAPAVAPLFFVIPYRGGPVMTVPKFYLTFWGYKTYGDPDKVQPLLEEYAKFMGGSAHNNIVVQYYEGKSGSQTYITNPKNQYGGSWDDDSAVPKSPTEAQVATEALQAVAHFGFHANAVYFVATAHKRSEVGFGTHWCSYHSYTFLKKQPITYAYFPYMPDAGTACGEGVVKAPSDESATDEGVTIFGGHEFAESITDPQLSSWIGPAGEIADQCQFSGWANETFRSKSYTMQPLASDANSACVQTYNP